MSQRQEVRVWGRHLARATGKSCRHKVEEGQSYAVHKLRVHLGLKACQKTTRGRSAQKVWDEDSKAEKEIAEACAPAAKQGKAKRVRKAKAEKTNKVWASIQATQPIFLDFSTEHQSSTKNKPSCMKWNIFASFCIQIWALPPPWSPSLRYVCLKLEDPDWARGRLPSLAWLRLGELMSSLAACHYNAANSICAKRQPKEWKTGPAPSTQHFQKLQGQRGGK